MKTISRTLIEIAAIVMFVARSDSQWVQTSGPEGGYVWTMVEDDEFLYAATFGPIFRMQKGDSVWTPLPEMNSQVLSACCLAVCGSTLVAGTDGGGVYRSSDHGMTWNRWISGLNQVPTVFSLVVFRNELYAGTNRGVYLSKDLGASWVPVNMGQDSLLVLSLVVKDSILFAGTWGGGVYRSNAYRARWAPANNGLTSTMVWSLAVIDSTLFAGTWWGEGVYRSTDNGDTWTVASSGLPNPDVNALKIVGGNLFAGTFGGLSVSTDRGESWLRFVDGPESVIKCLHVSGPDMFAGTFDGVYLSRTSGFDWSPLRSGLIGTVVNALVRDDTSLFAGTGGGALLRSDDDGASWGRTYLLQASDVLSLAVSGTTMFVGTSHGVSRSTDRGSHWTPADAGMGGRPVAALVAMPGGNGSAHLFAGTEGDGIFRSTNNGQYWTSAIAGLEDTTVRCLAVIDTNLFAGSVSGVSLSTDRGTSWSPVSTGRIDAPVQCFAVIDGNLFAGTEGEGVFLSTDLGASWSAINDGLDDPDVRSLAARGAKIFAGTWFGGVYLSENNGATWSLVDTGLRGFCVLALEVSSTDLCAGFRGDGVWRRPLNEMKPAENSSIDDMPATFTLEQSYPNPFNPSTTIEYGLPIQGYVSLKVYNMLGQEVAVLVDGVEAAGYKSAVFDATGLPSGVYLYRLTAGEFVATKKLVLLK